MLGAEQTSHHLIPLMTQVPRHIYASPRQRFTKSYDIVPWSTYLLQLKCNMVANEHCTMRSRCNTVNFPQNHDVIKWKHFRVTGHLCGDFTGHRWKGRWRGALMFSFICAWINGWVNNGEAGDLSHHAHYDVIVMYKTRHPVVFTPVISCL